MAETAKTMPQGPVKPVETRQFRYPSEEETFVRRLGAAVLTLWPSLPPKLQAELLAEANSVWDRERNIPALAAKLDAFVKRRR